MEQAMEQAKEQGIEKAKKQAKEQAMEKAMEQDMEQAMKQSNAIGKHIQHRFHFHFHLPMRAEYSLLPIDYYLLFHIFYFILPIASRWNLGGILCRISINLTLDESSFMSMPGGSFGINLALTSMDSDNDVVCRACVGELLMVLTWSRLLPLQNISIPGYIRSSDE